MARVMKGRLAKLIAQVAALALVVVGLVALVSTQRGAEATASADDAAPASADGADGADGGAASSLSSTVLNLERASQVNVTLPKAVTVKWGSSERDFATDAATVEDALRQGKVSFDGNDRLSPAGDTPVTSGMTVTVQRVATAKATTAKALPFKTVKVEDEDLARGTTKVVAEGRAGKQVTTWAVTTVEGKETGRKATGTEIVSKPVDRRIAVGTKAPAPKRAAKPAPQPSRTETAVSSSAGSSSSDSSAARSSSPSAATRAPSKPSQASAPASGAWQALAQCESGGNWSINTGNGYYGGLQFSASSWAGAGGTRYAPLPHQATPAEQIATAEVLRSNGGWGHWPACSSQLGLR